MAANDAWYESEESTRAGMVEELQRIRRRTLVRPWPVLALAALITGAITYKLATRKPLVEAEIVLALTEGALAEKHEGIPVVELREYVEGVLLPDAKLHELIERRDLYRLRKRLGDQYAIDELRSQIEIEIWKNTFMYFDERAEHSARIGLTVSDSDPDRAYELARDLAAIVIQTAQEHRQQMASQLAIEIGATREGLDHQRADSARERSEKQVALIAARRAHNDGLAQAIDLEIDELDREDKRVTERLTTIAQSRDRLVDRISAAGLDMALSIVEEHRPDRPEHRGFVIAMIAVVIGVGSLLGSALLIGAFDSRVHDTDDVERLGLPVLGHVPGFPGDKVGSLAARGAARKHVPSFLGWRSHR